MWAFPDPHHPHAVPTDVTTRVDPADVSLPDYDEGELDDKPPHFREAREGRLEASSMRGTYWVAGQGPGADYAAVSDNAARVGRAYYHTLVRMIDTQVGRIMAALDRHGMADNTVVVFTSDHGELLGDHGLWMKGPFHYEQLVRVPLIIRWPAGIQGGQRLDAITSLIDIAPTCLEAAGLPGSDRMDGRNMLPTLRGESASPPRCGLRGVCRRSRSPAPEDDHHQRPQAHDVSQAVVWRTVRSRVRPAREN